MSDEQHTRSWIRPFLAPIKPIFREIIAMSFFVNIMALAVPVFVLQVYDRVIYNQGISTLEGLLIGMMFVLIFDYILRQARSRILQTIALRIDVEVGKYLFRRLMAAPMKALEARPSAYWQALFRDVDVIRNTLSGASAVLIADLPFVVIFLTLIFIIATPVAWVLLVVLPVFMFVAWRSGSVMGQANAQELRSTQSRDDLIAEMIASRTTIKALALDRALRPIWEEKHANNIKNAIDRGRKTDSFTNLGASLSMMTSVSLTTIGVLAIIDQQITMGALVATNMLSGRILGPLNQLMGTWRTYNGFNQSVDRLGQLFQTPSERETSDIKIARPQGRLSIEAVSFSYSEELAPVVSNVTFKLAKGGIHALVGRNGSGKTTLLKLIQGLYHPSSGRITIDEADIAQFTRTEMACWMGYVPQESVLFAGNIRDNVAKRMPDASDAEIIKAATEAGVHQFIIDMPDGYATEIGEAGSRLSGGQRQRIAIARALVGDPPVIILDEPSSHLDRHAEQELRNTLKKISEERTVIVVTHSPILLGVCDFLYALDRGKLALAGPSNEILPRLFGTKPTSPGESTPTKAAPSAPRRAPSPSAAPQKPITPTTAPKPRAPKPQGPIPTAAEKAPPSPSQKQPLRVESNIPIPPLGDQKENKKAPPKTAPLSWKPPKRDKPLTPLGSAPQRAGSIPQNAHKKPHPRGVVPTAEQKKSELPQNTDTVPSGGVPSSSPTATPSPAKVLHPRGVKPTLTVRSNADIPADPPQAAQKTMITLRPRGRVIRPKESIGAGRPPRAVPTNRAPIRPVSIVGAPGVHAYSVIPQSAPLKANDRSSLAKKTVTLHPLNTGASDTPKGNRRNK